jgi:maleylacetoacetate isomerase
LRNTLKADEGQVTAWYGHWIKEGFDALEALVSERVASGFCFGRQVSIADLCLVPQMYNARRFAVDLAPYPALREIDAHLQTLSAFRDSAPENQSDAV